MQMFPGNILFLLTDLPEPPGLHALIALGEFPFQILVVQREEEVMPFKFAVFVAVPEEFILEGQFYALPVHGEKAVQERKDREIAGFTLEPESVRTIGTDHGGILVLLVGLPGVSDTQKEPRELLMGTAAGQQPSDFVLHVLPSGFQARNPILIRLGCDIDKRGNHPDLAIFGPGNKRVVFA